MARKAKKRPSLSPEKVLAAALELVDRTGLESLSMRNLAQALRVEAMSLYNHVPGKDGLLDGLVELVVGEFDLPAVGEDWRTAMRQRAMAAHAVLMRHPWAPMLLMSRINVGPNMLGYIDRTVGCLREAGFSWAMADHAWNTLDAYTYGFTMQRLTFPIEPEHYASAASEFLPLIPAERYPYMNGLAEEVIGGRHDGLQHLELGLDLLLDGLERLRTPAA